MPFIDRNEQVKDGLVLPGLLHDWIHLSGWAADATAAAVIRTFGGTTAAAAKRAAHFQVYCEDPGGANGALEYTIDEPDFISLKNADPQELILLSDVNAETRQWVNRARIVRVVGPL